MLLYLRMACPYFLPREPFAATEASSAFPRPLGDGWRGECTSPLAGAPVAERHMLDCCNMGYCGGKCAAFPDGGNDATRFGITADNGAAISVHWVAQRNHLPAGSGRLTYLRTSASFQDSELPPVLAAQAGAYVASYLRRTRTAR